MSRATATTEPESGGLFSVALEWAELSAEQRPGFMGRLAERDPDLAAELLALTESVDEEQQVSDDLQGGLELEIEGYGVDQDAPCASGPLSIVWRARLLRLDRSVALKVAAPGLSLHDASTLLDQERRLLDLSHPNIARIRDIGRCRLGQTQTQYLATDWIDGDTLDVWAKGRSDAEIVAVLLQVCHGLEYIHRMGVAHFDLKPQNVIIDEGHPEVSVPRAVIIDFGGARPLLDARPNVATYGYESPEQHHALTHHTTVKDSAACDCFAFGMMTVELLTGVKAHPDTGLNGPMSDAEYAEGVASKTRGVRERKLRAIVRACLRRDPAQRPTIPQLAESLRAWRRGVLPPQIIRYRARLAELIRLAVTRFPAISALSVAVAVVLAVAALLAVRVYRDQSARLQRQLDIRTLLELDAEYDLGFLGTAGAVVLDAGDRELLLGVAPRLDELFPDDIQRRAHFQGAVGRLLLTDGQTALAEPYLRQTYDLLSASEGESDTETLRARFNLAQLLAAEGDWLAALAEHKAILELREQGSQSREDVLASRGAVARCLLHLGRPEAAWPVFREVADGWAELERAHVFLRSPEPVRNRALHQLIVERSNAVTAMSSTVGIDIEEISTAYREMLLAAGRAIGEEALVTLTARTNYGVFLASTGRLGAAQSELAQALVLLRHSVGAGHQQTILCGQTLGIVYLRNGDASSSERVLRSVWHDAREALGEGSPITAGALLSLSSTMRQNGKQSEAAELLRRQVNRETIPIEWRLALYSSLVACLLDVDPKSAAMSAREGLLLCESSGHTEGVIAAALKLRCARAMQAEGDRDDAVSLLTDAWPLIQRHKTQHPELRAEAVELAAVLQIKLD